MRRNHASTFTMQLNDSTQNFIKKLNGRESTWLLSFCSSVLDAMTVDGQIIVIESSPIIIERSALNIVYEQLVFAHNNQPSTHGVVPFVVPSFNWWHCGQGNIILIGMQQSTPCTNNWSSINLMNKLQEIHTTINHLNATALIDGIMGKITKF